jgi:eukaryotic-like serine/threonine-protein kinase
VLEALDAAASRVRGQLGESLATVQQFATPLAETTTPSLEALKTFSLGNKAIYSRGMTAAIPFFKRAIGLDPNFAAPYANLAAVYANLGEASRAVEYARKAYERRDKVSERERIAIESQYYQVVTGELEKTVGASFSVRRLS